MEVRDAASCISSPLPPTPPHGPRSRIRSEPGPQACEQWGTTLPAARGTRFRAPGGLRWCRDAQP